MTTIRIPTEPDSNSQSVESLQKRIIELQDAELVRLRLELNQLKFELSKLQAGNPSQPVSVPTITITPYETWPKITWGAEARPPPFTTTWANADSNTHLKIEKK